MPEKTKQEKRLSIGLQATLIMTVVLVIAISWHKFYYTKNYTFVLEAPCDVSSQTCFIRSCMNEGDYCPPNNLQAYRVFRISAADFAKCSDNTCLAECLDGTVQCYEEECVEDGTITCSTR